MCCLHIFRYLTHFCRPTLYTTLMQICCSRAKSFDAQNCRFLTKTLLLCRAFGFSFVRFSFHSYSCAKQIIISSKTIYIHYSHLIIDYAFNWIIMYSLFRAFFFSFDISPSIFALSADPRTKPWLLSGSPGPLLTILMTYLYFCLYAGPRYMKDRKPFELKNTLIIYNIVQVILSVALVVEVSIKN